MNILICDDELANLKEIEQYCKRQSGVETVLTYSDSSELLEDIKSQSLFDVDLFVLDIEMPIVDGIALKESIQIYYNDTTIIFLTSHEEMMEQAFGRNVVAFVQKSNWETRLGQEIEKSLGQEKRMVEIETNYGMQSIREDDILMIEAANYYSKVYLTDKCRLRWNCDAFLQRRTMKEWLNILDESNFCKLSRSQIINFSSVIKFAGNKFVLCNGKECSIPKGKVREIKIKYFSWISKARRVI